MADKGWARPFRTGLSWLRHRAESTFVSPVPASIPSRRDVTKLYEELLSAVAQKHEGETRHQTALRYIQERESRPSEGPFKA